MDIITQVSKKISELNKSTILIHSDLMHGFKFEFRNRVQLLSQHIEKLFSVCAGADLWMPTFNYEFCRGIAHDVFKTPSVVGVLTEYFRVHQAVWRTGVPVFSFAGTGDAPPINLKEVINPFGRKSAFDILYSKDALLMHYGSSIRSSTILHYVESIFNQLSYRYDKVFTGQIVFGNSDALETSLKFHVRPLNRHLDYDWGKIERDLVKHGIVTTLQHEGTSITICSIRELVDFWLSRLDQDSLYLLDSESKAWVQPTLQSLGRAFIIDDFETV